VQHELCICFFFFQIYAVYKRNKKLLAVLGVLFVAEIAATLTIVDLGLPHGKMLVYRCTYKSHWRI
jgi:hypothetical protein